MPVELDYHTSELPSSFSSSLSRTLVWAETAKYAGGAEKSGSGTISIAGLSVIQHKTIPGPRS